jgi:hypothetical protein
MDLQDLYNFVDFWSKRGDQPGTAPQVTGLRDAMKDTGKVVDDYVLGGTYQANMRGQDELLRQLLINAGFMAAGAGVGAGVGKVAQKVTPELAALRNYLTKQQVVLHGTPLPVKGNQLVPFAGSEASMDAATIFTSHPFADDAIGDTMRYANIPFGKRGYFPKGMTPEEITTALETYQPTVVVGRTPKSNLYDFLNEMPMSKPSLYKSSEPIKIVDRIEAAGKFSPGENDRYNALVKEALKKAGVGTKTSKLLAKIPKKK